MNLIEEMNRLKEEIDWDFRESYIGSLYDENDRYAEIRADIAEQVLDELNRWLTKYIEDLEDYEEI